MEIYTSGTDNDTSITVSHELEGIKFQKHVISKDLSFELGSHFLVMGPVDIEYYSGWDDLNKIAEDLENRGNKVVWLTSWVSSPLGPSSRES